MFCSRLSLLSLFLCSLFALSLSLNSARAQVAAPVTPTPFEISDTQLNPYSSPGPVGPYQSKDEIDYTTSLSGSLVFIKMWKPGYVPSGNTDDGGDGFDLQEFTPIIDGSPHTYFDTAIWSEILDEWKSRNWPTGSACYYSAHMIGYISASPPQGQVKVERWGAMLYYAWIQQTP